MVEFRGGCHCGNLEMVLATGVEPEDAFLRACACSFCRAHGARTVTDPGGRLELFVRDPGELVRYQFGERTAEFLVCRRCGVYAAAVMAGPDGLVATINVNALADRARFARAAQPVDYEGESAAARRARRAAGWTPTVWAAPRTSERS